MYVFFFFFPIANRPLFLIDAHQKRTTKREAKLNRTQHTEEREFRNSNTELALKLRGYELVVVCTCFRVWRPKP
jgi:antitoxin (DNA-binding transcriptional repressor) of toxin-antitoxin stability system